jgi:L-alanine-DL-glutamate epimerase-like enolase superfamily enzyme
VKITSVEAIPIESGPLLVRVRTDEGIEGIGEAQARYWRSMKPFIEETLGDIVIGMDPRDTQLIWDAMFPPTKWIGPGGMQMICMGAIDIACWDIAAKSASQPLHRYMNGAARTHLPVYWSTGIAWQARASGGVEGDPGTPAALIERMREGREAGFTAFKLRLEWMHQRQDVDPEGDLARFKACKEFLGDECRLSIDINNGYSVSTAIEQGLKLQDMGAAHYEEPLPQYDYAGLKQVVDALDMPVTSGELEHTLWNFRDLIEIGDPDILQPDLLFVGGITPLRKIFTLCEAFNKPVLPHGPGAGIQNAVSLHVFSTQVNATLPHEYSWEFNGGLENATRIYEEAIVPKDGFVDLPDRPGHGLVAVGEAVEAYRIDR